MNGEPQYVQLGGSLSPTCEFGVWNPTVTFITPGDLVVAYTTRSGTYERIGDRLFIDFAIQTSTFTFTTSALELLLTGVPFTFVNDGIQRYGGLSFQGITKAGYTQFSPYANANGSTISFKASGQAQGLGQVNAADTPSAGTLLLRGSLVAKVAP